MSPEKKPKKRLIGCARVSTQQQGLPRQTKALKRVGCAVIYSDKASGKSMAGRPELARALDDLDAGDELVIAEWDRATRSMWDPKLGLRIEAVTGPLSETDLSSGEYHFLNMMVSALLSHRSGSIDRYRRARAIASCNLAAEDNPCARALCSRCIAALPFCNSFGRRFRRARGARHRAWRGRVSRDELDLTAIACQSLRKSD
jgi:hypothetical protein